MSIFSQDNLLQKVKTETHVSVIKDLLTRDDFETKTEIHNALGMSVADLIAVYYMNPDEIRTLLHMEQGKKVLTGHLIAYLLERYRINMISKNRKSREETTRALQGVQQEESATNAFRKLFGGFA